MVAKLCTVEEREPDSKWQPSYYLARLNGLSPLIKSFNFKMIHQILPCKERVSQILPNSSPTCILCGTGQPESLLHACFFCDSYRGAAMHLLDLTQEKMVRLQINFEALYEFGD